MEKDPNVFEEHMGAYEKRSYLVRNLFWNRIRTALKFAKIDDNSIVLDIGCNTGHLLRTLRKSNSACECWGIDVEPKIVTLKIENCKFKVADARKTPFENDYFSVIFATDILEHIKDVDAAITEIKRILKNDGIFVLCGPTESWFYKFCRLLLTGTFSKNVVINKPSFRGEIDFHFHTIYELEKKFESNKFIKLKQKLLPGFFFPTLFRITKYTKAKN